MSSTSSNPPSELLRRLLEASANSPIAEARSDSLDELMLRVEKIFNKPPLDLSDEDIVDTVLYFRHQRAKFSAMSRERESEPKSRGRKTTTIKAIVTDDEIEL